MRLSQTTHCSLLGSHCWGQVLSFVFNEVYKGKNQDLTPWFSGVIGYSIELPQPNKAALLSNRERERVYFLSRGYTDKKIAKQLSISPRTVETHILAAKRRLSVTTRAELIALFCRVHP